MYMAGEQVRPDQDSFKSIIYTCRTFRLPVLQLSRGLDRPPMVRVYRVGHWSRALVAESLETLRIGYTCPAIT